jgi:hypothetical protein
MVLSGDGTDLYVGGDFDSYTNAAGGGTPTNIARLNANNGALETDFVDNNKGFNNIVRTMVLSGDGTDLYVGGTFTSYTNDATTTAIDRIAKLNANTGVLITGFVGDVAGEGFNDEVITIILSNDGNSLYVGGKFISYVNNDGGGGNPLRLTKLATNNGAIDNTFINSNQGFDQSVYTMALSGDGTDLYVGGNFTTYTIGGLAVAINRIAKLNANNGVLDINFVGASEGFDVTESSSDVIIVSIVLSGDGTNLYVGGIFTSYTNNGDTTTAINRIAKLNANNGVLDTNFVDSGQGYELVSSRVVAGAHAIVLSGNNLYVGGAFNSYTNSDGATEVKGIASLNPTNGTVNKI